jgi:L-ascorbate metabolism protein UlaG (beta-lactamase superfamily)
MSLDLRWLGTACCQIVLPNDIHVVLDPYMDDSHNSPIASDQIDRCDYIFLTHGHWDHVLDVGKLASRFSPRIYCNQDTAKALIEHQHIDPALIDELTVNDIVDQTGFKVEVLFGIHTNAAKEFKRLTGNELPKAEDFNDPLERMRAIIKKSSGTDQIAEKYPEWRKMYSSGGEQLNFIFEGKDGQRLYVAGSYPDPRVVKAAKKAHATITLLQCMSANKLHGIEQETADVAIASGCKTVIPQHHDPIHKGGYETDLTKLKHILSEQSDMTFLEMVPGRWYAFEQGKAIGDAG